MLKNFRMNSTRVICLNLILFCFLFTVDAYPSYDCVSQGRFGTPHISRYRSKEYLYFINEKVDHFSAYCRCIGWDAQLLTIKNIAVQMHINRNMPELLSDCNKPPHRAFFYMGLYRFQGVWTWPDDTTLGSFNYWKQKPGPCNIEPNGYKDCFTNKADNFQNSTQIFACNTNHSDRGRWFDKHPEQSRWYYICERPYTPPPTKPPQIRGMTSRNKKEPSVRTTTESKNVVTRFPATSKKNAEYSSTNEVATATTSSIRPGVVASTTIFRAIEDTTQYGIAAAGTTTNAATFTRINISTSLKTDTLESTVSTTDAPYFDTSTNSSIKAPETTVNVAATDAPSTNIAATNIAATNANTAVTTAITFTTAAATDIIANSDNSTPNTYTTTASSAIRTGTNSTDTDALVTTTDTSTNTSTTGSMSAMDNLGKSSRTFAGSDQQTIIDQLQSNFNITDWEDNLSKKLSVWFFQHNKSSSQIEPKPGAMIQLIKFNSKFELLDEYPNKGKDGSSGIMQINLNANNSVFLSISQLQNSTFPIVIVAADLHQDLWKNSLTNICVSDTDRYALNKKFKLLPKGGSILSVSVYEVNDDNTTNKISNEVWPVFDLGNDSTVCDFEKSYEGRVPFEDIRYQCGFITTGQNETWSQEGCELHKVEGNKVVCHCNHTTAFGIILAFRAIKVPPIVSTVVTVLQSITIVALAFTLTCLLILRKKLHNSRTIVQINLATSLLFLHFFFVLGGPAVKLNAIFCEMCAVLTHYFTLSTAFWMLNEGLVLYFRTCKTVLSLDVKKLLPILIAVAWGVPFLLVLVCVVVGFSYGTYMDVQEPSCKSNSSNPYHSCWIGVKQNMIYSVIVPLSIIFIVTGCIVIRTAVEISKMSRRITTMRQHGTTQVKRSEKKKTRFATAATSHTSVAVRAVALLLPVLGVPWVLGFLVNIRGSEEIMQILHGIINGLQGVFIFFIYCIKNSQFRRAFCRTLSNYTNQDLPSNSKLSRVLSFSSTHPKTKIRV